MSVQRILAALALCLCGGAAQAQATITIGSLQLTRCAEPQIYCGRLARPLDPAGQAQIDIFFEYVPPRDPASPPIGTLVAAEGGPGFPTTGSAETYLGLLRPIMDHRDLVLMDYRGTGRSGAIDCQPLQTAPKLTPENIARCGRQLGAKAPFYTAVQNSDDLAAILTVLDRGKVDLYGDSYGTWFAQIFAVRHAALMRSIVLDGAYPVRTVMGESPWQPFYAPAMRSKFDGLCARDPACAAIPGDPMKPALQMLRAHPMAVSALDADGKRQHFRADPTALALVMFGQSPSRTTARETDAAARAFAAGDRLPLLRLMAEAYATVDSRDPTRNPVLFSEGQAAAVSCFDSEQIYDMRLPPKARAAQRDRLMAEKAAAQPDLYAPFTFAEYRGLPLDYEYLDGCVGWPAPPPGFAPHDTLPKRFAYPAIPALVISGEFDDVTSRQQGAIAAAQFPQGRHVIVANSFHVNALTPARGTCIPDLVRRFIETLAAGDTACAEAVPAVPLVALFPRRAADMPPAQPVAGNEADAAALSLAAAAIATADDAIDRLESRQGEDKGPGLRGGSFTTAKAEAGTRLTLGRLRWTEDLAVSGTVEAPDGQGTVTADLSLEGPQGSRGTLTASWPVMAASSRVRIAGVLDGKPVRAEMPAP
jgi:pimeloyl-ACP methyl ester carboxylesterase